MENNHAQHGWQTIEICSIRKAKKIYCPSCSCMVRQFYEFTMGLSVHGQWSNWTEWTTCSVTCGGGNQTRFRLCDNPAPQYNGSLCDGNKLEDFEEQDCNTNFCPSEYFWILVLVQNHVVLYFCGNQFTSLIWFFITLIWKMFFLVVIQWTPKSTFLYTWWT